jgi:hypothetical protein
MYVDARLQEHHIRKARLPKPRRTPQFSSLPISNVSFISAATRRYHSMRRAAIAFGILEAA